MTHNCRDLIQGICSTAVQPETSAHPARGTPAACAHCPRLPSLSDYRMPPRGLVRTISLARNRNGLTLARASPSRRYVYTLYCGPWATTAGRAGCTAPRVTRPRCGRRAALASTIAWRPSVPALLLFLVFDCKLILPPNLLVRAFFCFAFAISDFFSLDATHTL